MTIPPDALPYCTAPFTALLIDPNKGVRPCCSFEGHLGNMGDRSLRDIIESAEWKAVQNDIASGGTPEGCIGCYQREQATGWSVRTSFMQARATGNGQWRKGLTEVEINTTNLCNLACTHCSVDFSSRWAHLVTQLEDEGIPHYRRSAPLILKPDQHTLLRQLSALDLTHLDIVRFKGGEPMLNTDVPAVLRFLHDRQRLDQIRISIVTNGSIINKDVLALLHEAESVEMCISVDGVGTVQEYIRHGPSGIPRIEQFIAAFAALRQIEFNLSISVMAYNAFSLDRITAWYNALGAAYPGKMRYPLEFHIEVIDPPILSLNVLSDSTRAELIEKYERLSDADYRSVIAALKRPFAGVTLHNEFIAYTQGIDKVRKTNVLDAVPELMDEMVLLDPAAPANASSADDAQGEADPATAAIRQGTRFSMAGSHERALREYDRYFEQPRRVAKAWPVRLRRAIVLGVLERWDESVADFDRIIRPNAAETLSTLARADHGVGGAIGRAAGDLSPAEAALVQRAAFGLFIEGLAYAALDQPLDAAARFESALELDSNFMLATVAGQRVLLRTTSERSI